MQSKPYIILSHTNYPDAYRIAVVFGNSKWQLLATSVALSSQLFQWEDSVQIVPISPTFFNYFSLKT